MVENSGLTDETARHGALVGVLNRHIGRMRSAVTDRHAEAPPEPLMHGLEHVQVCRTVPVEAPAVAALGVRLRRGGVALFPAIRGEPNQRVRGRHEVFDAERKLARRRAPLKDQRLAARDPTAVGVIVRTQRDTRPTDDRFAAGPPLELTRLRGRHRSRDQLWGGRIGPTRRARTCDRADERSGGQRGDRHLHGFG